MGPTYAWGVSESIGTNQSHGSCVGTEIVIAVIKGQTRLICNVLIFPPAVLSAVSLGLHRLIFPRIGTATLSPIASITEVALVLGSTCLSTRPRMQAFFGFGGKDHAPGDVRRRMWDSSAVHHWIDQWTRIRPVSATFVCTCRLK